MTNMVKLGYYIISYIPKISKILYPKIYPYQGYYIQYRYEMNIFLCHYFSSDEYSEFFSEQEIPPWNVSVRSGATKLDPGNRLTSDSE